MGGMPSTNAPGYAPQQSPAPAAGGKMPASQSQYGPPQQNPQPSRRMSPSQIARQQALAAQTAGTPLSQGQQLANLQQAMTQSQQAALGQGQQIPQDVLNRYNQVNQPSQGPGGYGTQQQAPFQTQQMLNNVQQGTGALGQMGQQGAVGLGQYAGAGQQGYPQQGYPQQSAMPNDYYAVSGAPNQFSTGQSGNPSQLYGQFNQARGMGQGQQQQSYGSQSAGQPSGGFMSGTGGGTTGGGGMSRGKGFRSGGAVNNIRLSNDDVKRILNALATAREVVKNGK